MKEFKTLTIRNLDSPERADIVEIMNKVSNDYRNNCNTGQSIIEHIIRKYDLQRKENEHLIKEINEAKNEIWNMKRKIEEFKRYFAFQAQIHESLSES